ncbi:MAG: UbiD family decarboxylase [Anaerolineae bacterium]|jgi:UbiD family decarboxylase|nr:UbiD family decarboxylase [Anaerolineae bacterium]MDH7472759.1 UbiD family decarboxylase [Anaerolineae bacterium]
MNLREFIATARDKNWLVVIEAEADPDLEMARILSKHDGKPVLFTRVKGYPYPVVAGICSDRAYFALALGVSPERLLFTLAEALAHPVSPPLVESAPCQEMVEAKADLTTLPILHHLPGDAGPYVTAGVLVVKDPDYGRNIAFHRLLRLDERRFAARLVEGRGTHTAWSKTPGDLEVAICLGAPIQVLIAAATSPSKGVDELSIAHALAPTPLVKCRTKDLEVPAECEFILEGRLTHQMVAEGPFIDLTETWDIVRQQPVIEIDCITHRRQPIYQALLPGKLEHKLLMGLPREPTIYAAVNEVCDCRNVYLTAGGMSWLHAVVQIAKRHPDDGPRAIEAAFRGHTSLKHVVVVDEDVDLFNPAAVEWAIATRFQANRDLVVLDDQPSSSLDPSATHVPGQKSRTSKMGLDATIPWLAPDGHWRSEEERAAFWRVEYES